MTAKKKPAKGKAPPSVKARADAAVAAAKALAAQVKATQMDVIATDIGKGIPLAEICRQPEMPGLRTVYDWMEADADFAARIARAREAGYDQIAHGLLEIADDARNDWMERFDAQGKSAGYVLNGEHVQRSKLRIETRLKLLAKWDPKRYGEKVEHEVVGKDGGPIKTESTVSMPALDAYRLLKGGAS